MASAFTDKVRMFDLFRYKPEFQEKYTTALGIISSMIIAVFTVLATFGFGLDIFYRKAPTTSLNKEFVNVPELVVDSNFWIGIALYGYKASLIGEIDRYVD